jgi:acetyl esterase/lipase
MRSSLLGRVLLGTVLVGGAAAIRSGLARRRALSAVAAELRHPLLYLPLHLRSRWLLRLMTSAPPRPAAIQTGVEAERRMTPPRDEHPGVPVWVYQRAGRTERSGALLWIHGGGFVLGDPVTYHDTCSGLADDLGIVVVSVDYRLAPTHPFPAGLEDCYTALGWLHAHADELGVDPRRVAIGGDSAGAGLAACLAQLAHDRDELPVAFQLLVYPMLDDRTVLRSDHAGTGAFVWSPVSNQFGWTAYLGHRPRAEAPAPYAAAARRADLAGLPPAWIGVGDVDLFHGEDVEYARRLTASGVPCDLHVVPGMYHGADGFFPAAPSMSAFRSEMTSALRRALVRQDSVV